MKPSLLALATLAAYAGAAQAQTQSNLVSSDVTLTKLGHAPSMQARTVNPIPSPVRVLEELQITAVELACGCYPNNCGG
jgi:hypothetical protein